MKVMTIVIVRFIVTRQLRASAARRAARPRPAAAAAAESSACRRGIAVGLTSILDHRQFFVTHRRSIAKRGRCFQRRPVVCGFVG